MTVNREKLLYALESVQPGLATREILEQSSCFVFKNGEVITFNEEISCRATSTLDPAIEGAVQATPMLEILRKLQEDEIDVFVDEQKIRIKGKRRKSWHAFEQKIVLPIEYVEKPGKWNKLHSEFAEAINIVQQCAEKDESVFSLTCVHIHPEYVEACSNSQICRWPLKTKIKQATIVRRGSIRHITTLGVNEFSETDSWLHFRNPKGTILSCRRYIDTNDFPDLSELLQITGTPMTLPNSLEEAVEKANIFSAQNADNNYLRVVIRPGKFKIIGEGISGGYEEFRNFPYDGPAFEFLIAPELLKELAKKHRDCIISEDRLKVDAGSYQYLTCLSKVPTKNGDEE